MAIIDIAISLAKYAACIYFPYVSFDIADPTAPVDPSPQLLLLCAVMRHGPNKLIFNSAQALRDIYHNERVTKSDVYLRTVAAGTPSVLSTLDKQAHRTRRKVIAQAINDKAAHAFALTMIAQVDIFVDQLSVSSRDGRPVDMTDRCKRLGMVIVGLLAFGYLLHMQTDETNRFMLRGLSIGTWQNNSFMQFPLLKKLGMHHLLLLHGYYQRRMYKRTLQTMIRRRLSEEKHAQNDLYSFVADRLDNASDGMTTTDLWAEALFFIPADYFPDPFAFRPERWLVDDDATLRRMHSAFCPFSVGARACAGKPMAYFEASLVFAKTLWRFDFEAAPGKVGEVGAGVSGRTDGRGRDGRVSAVRHLWFPARRAQPVIS
ncbi:cytochrome P450 [Hypoxylon fuscum]|nr:cytochrome P450 [Hypoxylon fuscum]